MGTPLSTAAMCCGNHSIPPRGSSRAMRGFCHEYVGHRKYVDQSSTFCFCIAATEVLVTPALVLVRGAGLLYMSGGKLYVNGMIAEQISTS